MPNLAESVTPSPTPRGSARSGTGAWAAYSYGTNTASYALTRATHAVDTFTMYGSAGIDAQAAEHAWDLKVAETSAGRPAVYATDAGKDGTSDIGKNLSGRADPTETDFGAYVFSSDGTAGLSGPRP